MKLLEIIRFDAYNKTNSYIHPIWNIIWYIPTCVGVTLLQHILGTQKRLGILGHMHAASPARRLHRVGQRDVIGEHVKLEPPCAHNAAHYRTGVYADSHVHLLVTVGIYEYDEISEFLKMTLNNTVYIDYVWKVDIKPKQDYCILYTLLQYTHFITVDRDITVYENKKMPVNNTLSIDYAR